MGSVLTEEQITTLKQRANSLKVLRNIRNPEALLQMAASQNPAIKSVLEAGKQSGGNYDSLTVAILQQAGYDPDGVRQQFVEAGII